LYQWKQQYPVFTSFSLMCLSFQVPLFCFWYSFMVCPI
jgi:hypothetical protein